MNVQEFRESLEDYKLRCKPGSFMEAVLSNDLLAAVECADHTSAANLADFVRITYNTLPGYMWGTPERVRAHLAVDHLEGEAKYIGETEA